MATFQQYENRKAWNAAGGLAGELFHVSRKRTFEKDRELREQTRRSEGVVRFQIYSVNDRNQFHRDHPEYILEK